ncbi:hypothetical protein T492DRAFT_1148150 [Pavlovales sp. CCMP2436]|nr:hypothetical protein T492DRAFT_1148150 [Pavlovales sp. CCMP2436]
MLAQVVIVNAPSFINSIMRVASNFLSQKVMDKFRVCTSAEQACAAANLPYDLFPSFLGGGYDWDAAWIPEKLRNSGRQQAQERRISRHSRETEPIFGGGSSDVGSSSDLPFISEADIASGALPGEVGSEEEGAEGGGTGVGLFDKKRGKGARRRQPSLALVLVAVVLVFLSWRIHVLTRPQTVGECAARRASGKAPNAEPQRKKAPERTIGASVVWRRGHLPLSK